MALDPYFRDHGGDPMSMGGIRQDGSQLIAVGGIIQHIGP
jgi:hypothetical protein